MNRPAGGRGWRVAGSPATPEFSVLSSGFCVPLLHLRGHHALFAGVLGSEFCVLCCALSDARRAWFSCSVRASTPARGIGDTIPDLV